VASGFAVGSVLNALDCVKDKPVGRPARRQDWRPHKMTNHPTLGERRIAMNDHDYMQMALELAREAAGAGEAPVGAVIVMDGRVVGRGRNSPIALSDPTAHAEILAMREASAALHNYRLPGAVMYVTLEPCVMCAGAMVAARDLRFGGVRSKFRIADSELLNHRIEIEEGVLGAECAELLKAFFTERR